MANLFIISAPSGAGKSTLCKAVLSAFKNMVFSVSYTTRKPRPDETHGTEYYFIGKEEFLKGIENNKWAEWAEVHGNFYGTSAHFLDKTLSEGNDVLLDIDVQGTVKILKNYPCAVTVFIMPPSLVILKTRLEARKTDTREVIERRLENAKKEIAQRRIYRHILINDQLQKAIDELISIVESYKI